MPAQPPYGHSFNPAQQAQDAQRLLRYVKTHLPSKSPSMLVRRTPTGTVQTPIAQPNGGTFYNRRQIPTFYVYLSAGTNTGTINVRITGGTISHIYNGFSLWVPGTVSDLALSENDYVWLERTGNNAWGFGYGASFPEDKISFQLAKILLGGDGKLYVDYTGGWSGGDIIVSEQFPVALTQTGGGAGDATTMCSFSYSVATLDGVTLAELSNSTPVLSLARVIPGSTTAATRGTVRILADGSLVLWDCDEKQTNTVVERLQTANCP